MARALLVVITLTILATSLPATAQPSGDPPRERLGARAAFTGTLGTLNRHFGNGYDFTLYFTERVWKPLYFEVNIGATYFGDLLIPEIGEKFTGQQGIASEMRLAYVTIGPQYTSIMSETKTAYISLGLGIYTVSMIFDTGVKSFDLSDQHFGLSGGFGMFWRITDNWNIDVNATVNALQTDDDDLYPIFTGGGKNPIIYAVGLGLAMDLR